MTGSNYTVTVNVKDGGLLKKLEALQSSSPAGMTSKKMKRVTIEIDVPAKKWDEYLRLFGGLKPFGIYWSAVAADYFKNLDDDGNVRDSYVRYAKQTATSSGIAPVENLVTIEWPDTERAKDTMELVKIFAKHESSPAGVVIESVVRDHLEAYSEQVDDVPKAAKKLVVKWKKKSHSRRA